MKNNRPLWLGADRRLVSGAITIMICFVTFGIAFKSVWGPVGEVSFAILGVAFFLGVVFLAREMEQADSQMVDLAPKQAHRRQADIETASL